MHNRLLPMIILFVGLVTVSLTKGQATPVDAAQALIARVLPDHASDFLCEVIPPVDGKDVFGIEPSGKKIILRGNNGVSLAMAFNWYLRYDAKTSYDWQATGPLNITGTLPMPTGKVHQICLAPERFFLNYCTFGYTFPFTDFAGWQRFIDWMAMNGINRPLLQCGQDAVWYRVWKSYGLTDDQIRSYFTGPAHLPWHHMANIDKWGGPLPKSYIDGQMKLQQQILAVARSLGMKPILCGFAGHVPEVLKTIKPDAKITHISGHWGGFASEWTTWFLDPNDPLFKDIQIRLLKEQTALYGTDHLYAADPFNEITPPSYDPAYVGGVAKSIYAGMTAGDPDALWYQMAWTFYYDKNWLTKTPTGDTPFAGMCAGVPKGKMIFLDYYCEMQEIYPQTDDFYGAPFIWNYLGNFGGNVRLNAPLQIVSPRITRALKVLNCIGVGSTLEGLNSNPNAYELTLEQPWHDGAALDYKQWSTDYGARRGNGDPAVIRAWQILTEKVLTAASAGGRSLIAEDRGSIVTSKPAFDTKKDMPTSQPAFAPDVPLARPKELTDGLTESATELFKASPAAQATDAYRYDAVNIIRQLMSYQSDNIYARMMAAYRRHDLVQFRALSKRLLDIIRDMDTLVGTRHEYLVGCWIHDARAWGTTPTEADYYEHNARQLLTTWGGPGSALTDYARREWSGMLNTYYLPRWEEFISRLDTSLSNNKPFDFKAYNQWRNKHEGDWVDAVNSNFATEPKGDSVEIARQMLEKYR